MPRRMGKTVAAFQNMAQVMGKAGISFKELSEQLTKVRALMEGKMFYANSTNDQTFQYDQQQQTTWKVWTSDGTGDFVDGDVIQGVESEEIVRYTMDGQFQDIEVYPVPLIVHPTPVKKKKPEEGEELKRSIEL